MKQHLSEIETLLPQRDPFLFVDQLLTATPEQITGKKTYTDSFLYCQASCSHPKIIPGVILLESMMQCGGAGVSRLGLLGENILLGVASLERVRFFQLVEPPAIVTMVITNDKVSRRMLKQSGTSYCNGIAVLKATWRCLPLLDKKTPLQSV